MLQSDPSQWPEGISHSILPPHFIGGVAPSRHDVALVAYLEKQAAQRSATLETQANPKTSQFLWGMLLQMARRAVGAVWRPQQSHFESALK